MRAFFCLITAALLPCLPFAAVAQTTAADILANRHAALIEAAESGDMQAQLDVAQAYQHGVGVEKDPSEAIRWYGAAAEQSSPLAMFELGTLVFADFTADDTSAEAQAASIASVEWFHRSAVLGFAPAQNTLGLMHGFGDRTEIDRVKGRMWMEVAISNGQPAQKSLLKMLERQMTSDDLALALTRAETCLNSTYTTCD